MLGFLAGRVFPFQSLILFTESIALHEEYGRMGYRVHSENVNRPNYWAELY